MAKKKYYAVKTGKTPGIYESWDACSKQVHGFPGAIYKSFATREEAESFVGVTTPKIEAAEMPGQVSMSWEAQDDGAQAIAYVDGSYNVATGEYACGVAFIQDGEVTKVAKKGESKELAAMRNVAGEIMGSMEAMKIAKERGITSLRIYHDYQGIASWCLGEWKTNKEGTKDYKRFYDEMSKELHIEFVKVKGHSGDEYNDLADELAKSLIM